MSGDFTNSDGLAGPPAPAAAVDEFSRALLGEDHMAPAVRALAGDIPRMFREVERVTTTAFGRYRYPVTWSR